MKIIKVFGPPGTGKTTTLISTLKQELQDGIDPTEVAYLSHTKTAAEEVKSRISEQFSDLDHKKDLLWFRTIHSACFRKLGLQRGMNTLSPRDYAEFSKQTGYRVTGKSDIEDVLESHAESDTWDIVLTARSIKHHKMCGWDDMIDIMPDSDKLAPNSRENFLQRWCDYKAIKDKFDFTDMLIRYHYGNWGPLPVKVMFIDEAQDLSILQWQIIKQMSTHVERMYVAGDDDQAIYGFMGADEYGFLDLTCNEEIVLERSYRCPHIIGATADKIIRNIDRRKDKAVIWAGAGDGQIDEIGVIEFIDWQDLANRDTMVLCRHMKQVWTVKNMLDRMHIPCSVKGSSVVNNPSTKAIEPYLRMRADDIAVRPHEIARILERLGDDKARYYRELGRENRKLLLKKLHVLEIDWTTHKWPDYLAKNSAEYRIFSQLQGLLDTHGLDIIGSKPNIDVMTYHACKGKEADVVVMLTDVYNVVADNPDQTGEIRLAYVGLTRAKERAIIVRPETGMYMRHLLGR